MEIAGGCTCRLQCVVLGVQGVGYLPSVKTGGQFGTSWRGLGVPASGEINWNRLYPAGFTHLPSANTIPSSIPSLHTSRGNSRIVHTEAAACGAQGVGYFSPVIAPC